MELKEKDEGTGVKGKLHSTWANVAFRKKYWSTEILKGFFFFWYMSFPVNTCVTSVPWCQPHGDQHVCEHVCVCWWHWWHRCSWSGCSVPGVFWALSKRVTDERAAGGRLLFGDSRVQIMVVSVLFFYKTMGLLHVRCCIQFYLPGTW